MELNREAALVLVDIQRDLLPSGLKAVPRGDEVVAAANRLAESFDEHGLRVVATRCWLPADHSSFASQGGGLSPYCLQDTHGAEFADDLQLPEAAGLATDTTVRQTVIDALGDGFEVILVADACRGYNKHAADSARAVEDMLRAGARIASSGAVQNALEAYSAT
jgi:nicotinamidase/pyrazinamidase